MASDKVPVVQLSPEFLAGSTEAGLEKLRTRLLDLTSRNRLLNFRHTSASSLRVVGGSPDSIYRCLADGEKLCFQSVPEPDEFIGQKPAATEHAKALGWPTSFDLDGIEDAGALSLPVLHYVEQLETLSRKIGSAAKTAIEESGANMLYLIVGFLEWYESDDSQQSRLAPLITVPVSLDRGSAKGDGFQCSIEHTGEDLGTNLSLVERMRRDFGIEIPTFENDDAPDDYFGRFRPILVQKRRWKIRKQVTLTLLSFGKLLMYRDLDPATWPGIAKHRLVKELFEGRRTDAQGPAQEFAIDSPELKSELPQLILDADSSQHSALLHALRGQNLVIEGPPGTGKSQTITNLIGAALAKGKTVLFVAEKLAALRVVRKRLDEAGLGSFCLELHSNKTKKHALLNDVAARIQSRGSFRDPRELDHVNSGLEEKKQVLTQYVGEINRRVLPFDATVFEILWARDRFRAELPFTRELTGNVPNAQTHTRADVAHEEAFLLVYAQHLAAVLKVSSDLDHHPWSWLAKPLSFDEEEQLVELLGRMAGVLRVLIELAELLRQQPGLLLSKTMSDAQTVRQILNVLPDQTPAAPQQLLAAWNQPTLIDQFREFARDARNASDALGILRRLATAPEKILAAGTPEILGETLEAAERLGLLNRTSADLRRLVQELKEARQLLAGAQHSLRELQSILGCDVIADRRSIAYLAGCIRLIEKAPFEVLHLRTASLRGDGVRSALRSALEESERIKAIASDLSPVMDLAAVEDADASEILQHAKSLEDTGFLAALFSTRARAAKRAHARLAVGEAKRGQREMARDLRRLADYLQKRARFADQILYKEVFGTHFRGVETAWTEVGQIVDWYGEVYTCLPEHEPATKPLRELMLTARVDRLRALRNDLAPKGPDLERLASVETALNSVRAYLGDPGSAPQQLSDTLSRLDAIITVIERILVNVSATEYREDAPIASIPVLLDAASRLRTSETRVLSQKVVKRILGESFRGIETNLGVIQEVDQYASRLLSAGLPESAVTWLLSEDSGGRLAQILSWLAAIASNLGVLKEGIEEAAVLSGATVWAPGGCTEEWDVCLALCESGSKFRGHLPQWVHFLRARAQSVGEGLSRLTSLADAGKMRPDDLAPAFRYLFFDSLARGILAERPALANVTGLTISELRTQFAKLDKEAINLYRQRAASLIDRRPVPFGSQVGPVGCWTDLALVTHEINKQRRHIPIRQLMCRGGRALQALKPCFMMGPLSVAQYLAPGQLSFDLIVMDEASQMKPEDAVGALARGGQMVIVGDPKQLPPTTFFQRAAMDAESEDDEQTRTLAEDGESILDVASTLYQPVRRLRWHYRSRHHSLIAFSNKEFYQGDLVIFPSAFHDHKDLGVKYHPVRSAVFENGRNPCEAAKVVDAVMEHMQRRPDESLGVVTLNFEQGELIEELLDQRLRAEPFAIAYQEKMNSGFEPFFVKNLENVQGDERDVIFISATYGPDARGNQYQRFGPLNGANGHRRLNVLFTRAKKRTEVFSSLDPEQIHTGPGSAWGLRALKQYLIFARTGILDAADDGGGSAANDFERTVGSILRENGFEVVSQVGVAGFFIDLAVKHPTKPGSYLLGVECDGASYHSGRSARDRDRLREEILVNLGWRIHRIWSTDWFKSRNTEVDRLLNRIAELLAADPDYQRERTKQARSEALRQKLLEIRKDIVVEFGDSPASKCLLRDELLGELLSRRPKSKEDWFRSISQPLRAGTEPKQVGRYLAVVLEAIAKSGL